MEEPQLLLNARALLQSLGGERFEVSAHFNEIASWDTRVWSVLAPDLANIERLTLHLQSWELEGGGWSKILLEGDLCEEAMEMILPKTAAGIFS